MSEKPLVFNWSIQGKEEAEEGLMRGRGTIRGALHSHTHLNHSEFSAETSHVIDAEINWVILEKSWLIGCLVVQ